jgi:hypothetical protein
MVVAAALVAFATPVQATTFELDDTRTEAWAMRWFAALGTPTMFGVVEGDEPWTWSFALEGGWIPDLSEEERRVGFRGTKVEDLNRAPLFGRPIVGLSLPAEFSVSAGWVPPINFDGVEANVLSFTLARPLWTGESARVGAQLFWYGGELDGDITCPEDEVEAGDDPIGNPFRCEAVSRDTLSFDAWGAELGVAFGVGPEVELHLSGLWQQLDSEFQVRAEYFGVVDRDKLVYDGDSYAFTGGVSWKPVERWRFGGELFYSPLEVIRSPTGVGEEENDALFNFRVLAVWSLR